MDKRSGEVIKYTVLIDGEVYEIECKPDELEAEIKEIKSRLRDPGSSQRAPEELDVVSGEQYDLWKADRERKGESKLEKLVKKYGDTVDKSDWFSLSVDPETETAQKDQHKDTESK